MIHTTSTRNVCFTQLSKIMELTCTTKIQLLNTDLEAYKFISGTFSINKHLYQINKKIENVNTPYLSIMSKCLTSDIPHLLEGKDNYK